MADDPTDAPAGRRLRRPAPSPDALYEDIARLEEALTAPLGDAAAWQERAAKAGRLIVEEIRAHIDETEGDEGFLTGVQEEAPRLAAAVTRLLDEHDEMVAMADRFVAQIESPDEGITLQDVRALGVSLLGHADPAPPEGRRPHLRGVPGRPRQRRLSARGLRPRSGSRLVDDVERRLRGTAEVGVARLFEHGPHPGLARLGAHAPADGLDSELGVQTIVDPP